jgi:hypothetical protein
VSKPRGERLSLGFSLDDARVVSPGHGSHFAKLISNAPHHLEDSIVLDNGKPIGRI